ncbi:MATE family efflux transporter [Musicola paradisiaca]|uniref:Multi antimicrobial extrusion protein MatE n=1 Tax=Musicola paradisiaca (strain Ech703) TaxID=579405 RepID=C6C6J2_MUSP7|nr:MATE family efflux transporter [Musicola paradisiaca]ACS83911.1 multi antimicrobial extrusion protein MatE [Musicola paradisiaca Ech703]
MGLISRVMTRRTSSVHGDVLQIVVLAWPMMVTAIVVSLSQNLQIAILGNGAESQTLSTLSLLQPFNFLFIAIMECVAITNQVFSARSRHDWPRGRIWHSTLLSGGLGLLATTAAAALCYLLASPLSSWMGSSDPSLMRSSAPWYLLSMTPFMLLEVGNAALRGQGRTAAAMLLMCAYILGNALLCFVGFQHYQLGFDAVLLANAVAAAPLLPLVFVLVRRQARTADRPDDRPQAFLPRLLALLTNAGIPVFFSMVVVFFSSMVIFPMVARAGEGMLPAFLIVIKLRAFFIIPAVALGSAIAILSNQRLKTASVVALAGLLKSGLWLVVLVCLCLTLAVGAIRTGVLDGLSNDAVIRHASQTVLLLLLPTFFLTSLVAALQTLLEQLERGKRVLLFTLVLELAMAGVVLTTRSYFDDIRALAGLMVSFSVLYAVVFLREYRLLLKSLGERDAAV